MEPDLAVWENEGGRVPPETEALADQAARQAALAEGGMPVSAGARLAHVHAWAERLAQDVAGAIDPDEKPVYGKSELYKLYPVWLRTRHLSPEEQVQAMRKELNR